MLYSSANLITSQNFNTPPPGDNVRFILYLFIYSFTLHFDEQSYLQKNFMQSKIEVWTVSSPSQPRPNLEKHLKIHKVRMKMVKAVKERQLSYLWNLGTAAKENECKTLFQEDSRINALLKQRLWKRITIRPKKIPWTYDQTYSYWKLTNCHTIP